MGENETLQPGRETSSVTGLTVALLRAVALPPITLYDRTRLKLHKVTEHLALSKTVVSPALRGHLITFMDVSQFVLKYTD